MKLRIPALPYALSLAAALALPADGAITVTSVSKVARPYSSAAEQISGITYAGGDLYYAVDDNDVKLYPLTLAINRSDGSLAKEGITIGTGVRHVRRQRHGGLRLRSRLRQGVDLPGDERAGTRVRPGDWSPSPLRASTRRPEKVQRELQPGGAHHRRRREDDVDGQRGGAHGRWPPRGRQRRLRRPPDEVHARFRPRQLDAGR